jgi:hypothetical protein
MTIGNRITGRVLLSALALVGVFATTSAAQGNRRAPAEAKGLSSAQLENMQARIATATAIVNRFQAEAKAMGRASEWRQVTLNSLLSLKLSQLRRVEQQAFNADAIPSAISEAKADPTFLGEEDEDLVYTPLPPCRYIDTRIIGGRFFGFREYDLANDGSTYGGSATCDPTANFGVAQDEIGALAMNLTIIDPAIAPGFMAAKPTQNAPLSSLVNWYETGATVQAANMAIVPIDQSGAAPEFVLQTSAQVHAIVDILGAFLAPQASALEVVTVDQPWSLVAQLQFDVTAACPAGYTVTGGGFNANSALTLTVPLQLTKNGASNGFRCRGISVTLLPITADGTCQAICARTPGR